MLSPDQIQGLQILGHIVVCVFGFFGVVMTGHVLIEAGKEIKKTHDAAKRQQSLMNDKPQGFMDPFLKGKV
jgi:hypothetical protein